MLPFLLPNHKQPRGILDCERCLPSMPESQRAKLRCGWISRDKLPADTAGVPFNKTEGCTVCPGWLVKQPAVIDGAEAFAARRAGALEQFDPEGLNVIWEATSILEAAVNKLNAELLRQSTPVPHG